MSQTNSTFYSIVLADIEALKKEYIKETTIMLDSINAVTGEDNQAYVRRPTDGMRQRDDRYASLSITTGKSLLNSSSPSKSSRYTSNLMIQQMNYQNTEKVQTSQTFDQDRLFFFGQNLATVSVNAIVIENESFQWLHEFYTNYQNSLSGSELAEAGAKVELYVEGKRLSGYLTNFSFRRASNDLHTATVDFAMTVFKTEFVDNVVHEVSVGQNNAAEVLDNVNDAIQLSAGLYSSNVDDIRSADPNVLLSAQIDSFNVATQFSALEKKESKKLALRQAYPNEFLTDEKGRSIQHINEIYQSTLSAELLRTRKSGIGKFDVDDYLFGQGNRAFRISKKTQAEIINEAIQDAVSIREAEKVVEDQGEAYGVKYVPATKPNTGLGAQFARAGNAVLASSIALMGTALIQATTQEVQSLIASDKKGISDFGLGRVGRSVLTKVIGEDLVGRVGDPDVDEINFTGAL